MNSKKNNQPSSTASNPILSELRSNERELYSDLMNSDFDLFASNSTSDDEHQKSYHDNNRFANVSSADGQAFNDSGNASKSASSSATINTSIKPKSSTDHRSSKFRNGSLIIGAVLLIVIIALCAKAVLMPAPTTPKGYADYERTRIVRNIHKNEPKVKVTSVATDNAGILELHTNLATTRSRQVKRIWTHIYDKNGDPKDNCDEVKLYGTHGLLCEGNAQSRNQIDYGGGILHKIYRAAESTATTDAFGQSGDLENEILYRPSDSGPSTD